MYYADLGRGVGSEQEGYRPVVIIRTMSGTNTAPRSLSLDWLEMTKKNVEETTYGAYAMGIKSKIIPYFEEQHPGLALQDVTPKHIQDYYTYELTVRGCFRKHGHTPSCQYPQGLAARFQTRPDRLESGRPH